MRLTNREGEQILSSNDEKSILEALNKLREYENLDEDLQKTGVCKSAFDVLGMIRRGEVSFEVTRPAFEWNGSVLLKLPCPCGGKMYGTFGDVVIEYEIDRYNVTDMGLSITGYQTGYPDREFSFAEGDIGESVFFTREDAENYIRRYMFEKDEKQKKEKAPSEWHVER